MVVPGDRHAPRVLVIAPHPDDDAIGCGGTLARFAARGSHVDVTYVTDGSRSHRSKRFPPALLRDIREDEARAALKQLGVWAEPQFLRARDGGLGELDADVRAELVDELRRRIDTTGAEILFAPWPRDPHPDHIATAALVDAALANAARRPELLWYTVWLPVRGTESKSARVDEAALVTVELDALELACKRAAIMAHRSQTTDLVDDDRAGFRIDSDLLAIWLAPTERFLRAS